MEQHLNLTPLPQRLVDQLLSVFVLDTVGRVLTCTPMFASEDDGEIENAQLDMAASFRRYIAQLGDCPGQPAVEWTITHIFRPEVFPLIKEGAREFFLCFLVPAIGRLKCSRRSQGPRRSGSPTLTHPLKLLKSTRIKPLQLPTTIRSKPCSTATITASMRPEEGIGSSVRSACSCSNGNG